MIQKLKGIMCVNESLEEISKKIKHLSREVKSVEEDFKDTKSILLDIKTGLKEQTELINNINNDVVGLKSIKQDFEKEIYDFKLLKSSMQKEILQKFETDIESKLGNLFNKVNENLVGHTNIKKNYEGLLSKINDLSNEIDKFKKISEKIKEKDFALERYAKKLEQYEGDKIRLLKKIDTLERMVSKSRRIRN
jgi:chromosome segregation ATPase